MSPTRPFRLGVLFVHGIGSQPSGETLVRWGDALVKVIARASRDRVIATVDRARLGDNDNPTVAEVTIRSGDSNERWLLAEAWWAESFPAPSYSELVSWSIRAVPWSIAIHVAQRYWQTPSRESRLANIWPAARAFLQLILALLLAPILIVFLGLVLVLGALPIPQLRSWILAAQSAATATVGDSLAFLESPLRAGLIRSRIFSRLEYLQPLSDHTIVIAHSQGAAAVLDALGALDGIDRGAVSADDSLPGVVFPDALLTFGAGTNKLVTNKIIAGGLPEAIRSNPVSTAVWALLGSLAVFTWLYANVRSGLTSMPDVRRALWLWFAVVGSLSAVVMALLWCLRTAARKWKVVEEHQTIVFTGIGTVVILGLLLSAFWYTDRAHLPFGAIAFLTMGFMAVIASTVMLLSRDMKTMLSTVQKPAALKAWVDIFASADPVPNGETLVSGDNGPQSVKIWNTGSILADHTTYWDNLDCFVLRVVKLCAKVAESSWSDDLPSASDYIDRRAKWRVACFGVSRWITAMLVIGVGAFAGLKYRVRLILPFDRPRWLPLELAQYAGAIALIVASVWLSSGVLRWVWNRWVRAEQDLVLSHERPVGTPWEYLISMAMVVWMLLISSWIMTRPNVESFVKAAAWDDILVVPAAALGFAGISVWVLVKLMPPPKPEKGGESTTVSHSVAST